MCKNLNILIKGIFIFAVFILFIDKIEAQCTLYDYNGNPSNNPYWYSCNGNNFILNLQSPQNHTSYTVDWGDGSPIESGSNLNFPGSIFHNYTAAVDTFVVVFTNINSGCTVQGVLVMEEATSASIQIPIGGLTQACAPQTMEFINSSTNTSETTVFTWDFGDNSSVEVYDYTNQGQTVSHTYQPNTVECETFVTLTAENYCNTVQGGPSEATFNPIRIWDIDKAGIGSSSNLLCYPDTEVVLTNATERNCFFQGNIYQRYEYWNFGDYWGLGYDSIITWTPWPPTFPHNIAYPGIGTYEVLLLDSNLCGIDQVFTTIEIVGPPTANISTLGDTICAGQSVTFENNSTSNANAFRWNFGDGSGWVNAGPGDITRIFNTPGTYVVKLVARVNGPSNLCSDTAITQVVVLPGPVAQILLTDPSSCDTLDVTFSDGSSSSAITWDWNFGNGNISNIQNPPSQTYTIESAYYISLTVTSANGCVNTDTARVDVFSSPIVNIIPENICQSEVSQFIDGSIVSGGDNIVNWNWYFGDGNFSNDQNPEHTYLTSGSYTVLLTVSTPNCSADGSVDVNVEATPVASFATSNNQGCNPVSVNFTNQSLFAVSYIWNFGDGNISNVFEPSHTYINNSSNDVTFNCSLIALNAYGCADTSVFPITVHPYTESDFYSDAVPGCSAVPAQFTNLSTGAASFEWNFGDGTPISNLENPFHQYTNDTEFIEVYEVQLIAISNFGCNDTITDYISAYPIPNFDFTLPSDSGCAPFEVQFPQVSGAIQFNWNFGDFTTSILPSPTHIFTNNTLLPQSFEVTLVGLSPFGCFDTSVANIVVMPNPIASFQPDITNGCSPLAISLINNSQISDTYSWNYDNGDSSSTSAIVHNVNFENNSLDVQDFTISLTVTSNFGCLSNDSHTIEVYPIPIAAFVSDTAGCSPLGINFSNQSQIANNYFWDFGDGYEAFATNPVHIFYNQGNENVTYRTQLIAVSAYGCRDTSASNITVFPLPQAVIEIDTTFGCYPLTVGINNNSQDAVSYNWNYGDGNFSTTDSISHEHTYYNTTSALAQYNIILSAVSINGCEASTDINVLVPPQIIAGFASDTIGCTPLPINFTNTSIGAISYLWIFGDGSLDYSSTPQHTFTNSGVTDSVYTVTLVLESAFGCTDTISQNITVFAAPMASFIVSPQTQTFPDATVVVQNTSSGGSVEYTWTLGNGESISTFDYNELDSITYLNWGEFTISLNVDNGICEATALENIVIEPPLPIAYFEGENIGCEPLLVQFQNLSQFGVYYTWYFGDGSSSNEQNPEHVYYESGTYSVVLEVTGPGGEVDIFIQQNAVTVYKRANAIFTVSPESVFVPSETVYFTNLSENANTYTWDFGDGTISNEFSPEYNYNNEGWYNVILIANNQFNCPDTLKLNNAVFGKNDRGLEFPNAFTPNTQQGNGGLFSQLDPYANDVFFPLYKGVREYNLMIFNRWGELLFESNNVNRGWDGYYRGDLCKQDVYVWKVKAKFMDDSEIFKAGDVTLLR
jgi:gliding motility-associated-like protein